MSKRIDLESVVRRKGTLYPAPYDAPCRERVRFRLGDAAGLTQFGVNLLRLAPGVWSSQRHWHSHEDEFVYVLEGEVVLTTDAGDEILRAGDCAGFKAGVADGHYLHNESTGEALVLEVGSRRPSEDNTTYPGIDMLLLARLGAFSHADGTPY
jgi:uncharacterized cupin superfamily protein